MTTAPATPSKPPSRRATLLVMLLAFLCVLVPFLFWQGTWFGRRLTDRQMEEYLRDPKRPRHTQHALAQIAERMIQGDNGVKRWYLEVRRLGAHDQDKIRATAAWVMGQDNREEGFHQALLTLLNDPNQLVQQNAALSLVRFGDPRARPQVRAMLKPFTFPSPHGGTVRFRLKIDDSVNPGTLLLRLDVGAEEPLELRSPLPGTMQRLLVEDGAKVESGQPLLQLAPGEEQAWEALRALYFMGQAEDVPLVERYARGGVEMSARIQQQALLTLRAIRDRGDAKEQIVKRGEKN